MRKKILCIFIGLVVSLSAEETVSAPFEKSQAIAALSAEIKVIKKIRVNVTMYYGPEPGQERYVCGSYEKDVRLNGKGKETRLGKKPEIGTAAADWQIFKPGTKFRIADCDDVFLGISSQTPARDIIFEVQDTGSGVKGHHVDLFVGWGDHGRKIAENFGRRKMIIEVVQCLPQE